MSKVVIADSSCLIGLSKIGKLQILHDLFGTVLIPEKVYQEVVVSGRGRPGAEEVKNASWIETRTVQNQLAVRVFQLHLGGGESEAISLAVECAADFLILDDLKARQIAEELGLSVVGTVAVLYKSSEKGLLGEEMQTVLERLHQAGFRFLL
jgi:predicted nucleic acid-binding protein